jgi:hypothetical protein
LRSASPSEPASHQRPEIRDITGQVIVDAIEGQDVIASAKKAADLMDRKMER